MLSQQRGALGRFFNLHHVVAGGVLAAEIFADEAGKAENHGEQIVEIVRHATGELPHGFHLLGLTKLFFEAEATGHFGGQSLRGLRELLAAFQHLLLEPLGQHT